jgi:hypothetical protein
MVDVLLTERPYGQEQRRETPVIASGSMAFIGGALVPQVRASTTADTGNLRCSSGNRCLHTGLLAGTKSI